MIWAGAFFVPSFCSILSALLSGVVACCRFKQVTGFVFHLPPPPPTLSSFLVLFTFSLGVVSGFVTVGLGWGKGCC